MKNFKELLSLINEKQEVVANKSIAVGYKLPWYITGKSPFTKNEMSKVPPVEKEPEPVAEPPKKKESIGIKMGPSTVAQPQKKGPQPSPLYTVKQNENMRDIAKRHGMTETELMNLNKGVKDPYKVPAGTQIRTRK
jgi:LysM repeat protein